MTIVTTKERPKNYASVHFSLEEIEELLMALGFDPQLMYAPGLTLLQEQIYFRLQFAATYLRTYPHLPIGKDYTRGPSVAKYGVVTRWDPHNYGDL